MEAEDGHHHPHSHGGSHEEHEGVKERADGVVAEAGTEEIGGEDYVLVSPELIVLDELVRKVHDDGSGAISTFLGRHLRELLRELTVCSCQIQMGFFSLLDQ